MNLLLLTEEDFAEAGARDAEGTQRVRVFGRRAEHVRDILRAEVGQSLEAGLLGGRLGRAEVVSIGSAEVEFEVRFEDREPPPPLPVVLVLALPRPPTLRKVLQGATAMGVKHFVLISTRRVEKSYWQSPLLGEVRLREQMLLGLEQSRDTHLPRIDLRRRFAPFVREELPALVTGGIGVVGDVDASEACPRGIDGPAVVVIGPEGGLLDDERAMLTEVGMICVNIGRRPLRVEHAVPAILGRLF